jgi:hypothetical protein
MVKIEGGDVDALVNAAPAEGEKGIGQRLGAMGELFKSHPLLSKRIAALRAFSDGALYVQITGGDPSGRASTDDIDKQVADLLSVF